MNRTAKDHSKLNPNLIFLRKKKVCLKINISRSYKKNITFLNENFSWKFVHRKIVINNFHENFYHHFFIKLFSSKFSLRFFFQNLFSHSRSRIFTRIEWWYSQAPNRPREEDTDDFRFLTFFLNVFHQNFHYDFCKFFSINLRLVVHVRPWMVVLVAGAVSTDANGPV